MPMATDLNPAMRGNTTLNLANPRFLNDSRQQVAAAQMASGARIGSTSPLVFIGAAAAGLFGLSLLQKTRIFPKK